jgi:hypothetical protein
MVLRDCGHEEQVEYFGDRTPKPGGLCWQCRAETMTAKV